MANGIGFLGGFLIASALYKLGGYTLPFYFNSGVIIILLLIVSF